MPDSGSRPPTPPRCQDVHAARSASSLQTLPHSTYFTPALRTAGLEGVEQPVYTSDQAIDSSKVHHTMAVTGIPSLRRLLSSLPYALLQRQFVSATATAPQLLTAQPTHVQLGSGVDHMGSLQSGLGITTELCSSSAEGKHSDFLVGARLAVRSSDHLAAPLAAQCIGSYG